MPGATRREGASFDPEMPPGSDPTHHNNTFVCASVHLFALVHVSIRWIPFGIYVNVRYSDCVAFGGLREESAPDFWFLNIKPQINC